MRNRTLISGSDFCPICLSVSTLAAEGDAEGDCFFLSQRNEQVQSKHYTQKFAP